MDGPQEKKVNQEENMEALSIRDLLILKNFLEKARRLNMFIETEKHSVDIIHTKLSNLIRKVNEKMEEKNRT